MHCQRGFCLFKTFGLQEEPQSENALVQLLGHSNNWVTPIDRKTPLLGFYAKGNQKDRPSTCICPNGTCHPLYYRAGTILTVNQPVDQLPTTSCMFCGLFWPYYYIWLWSNVWWQDRRHHKNHISFWYIPSLNVFSVRFRVSLVFHH